MLGDDGMVVLQKLGEYDDRSVDRLCRAYIEGGLTKRELAAARLAVQQLAQR